MNEADNKVRTMTMAVAENSQELLNEIRQTTGATYTEGYHRRVSAMIAAMNVTRSALQTLLVQQTILLRMEDLAEGNTKLLK